MQAPDVASRLTPIYFLGQQVDRRLCADEVDEPEEGPLRLEQLLRP